MTIIRQKIFLILLVILALSGHVTSSFAREISPKTSKKYFAKVNSNLNEPTIIKALEGVGASHIRRTFPDCLPAQKGQTDLSKILTLEISTKLNYKAVFRALADLPFLDYISESAQYKPTMEYNDEQYDQQWAMEIINASGAHDLSIGDSAVVIAIVDTGLDMDHPDIAHNLWINTGEDINDDGIIDDDDLNEQDDDENGKIDDFYGWDFYEGDNLPEDDHVSGGHGTHCAGIASAVTNNETGVASIGYNCSLMIVRVGNPEVFDLEPILSGIDYAVRNGADVINLSFGGPQEIEALQDVINYAFENNVLVVGAAGNDNEDRLHFPAAHQNCMAVAATGTRGELNDSRAYFTNYGDWVDVSAPGYLIRSTDRNAGYRSRSGTSMSCPMVSGLAGLIKSVSPQISVEDIWNSIVDNADDIEDNLEEEYRGLMGSGRINATQSLQSVLDYSEIEINLVEGWNMISMNINPSERFYNENEHRGPDPVLLFEQLLNGDQHHLVILKDLSGRFYNQEYDYINLPFWDLTQGYLLKVDQEISVFWNGEQIAENTEIQLTEGWNMVAYYPQYELNAESPDFFVLSGIIDHVIIAKDLHGRFILPDQEYSNMEPWSMGNGYLIKVDQDVSLVYPEEPEENRVAEFQAISPEASSESSFMQTTGRNMSILFEFPPEQSLFPGDLVIARNKGGNIVGGGRVNNTPKWGMAVWGDDPTTEKKDGLSEGENFGFSIGDVFLGEWEYQTDGILIIDIGEDHAFPVGFQILETYPNPFNSTIHISCKIPFNGKASLEIFDISGRMIHQLFEKEITSDYINLTWDSSNISAGIYFVNFKAGSFNQIEKILLVK